MKHLDWRSFGQEAQEAIRKIAVRAVDENSESPDDVIRILGITKSRLYDWLSRYRQGGYEALNIHRGRGEHPSLNEEQQIWIGEQITNKTPEDFGYKTKLWTTQIISAIVKNKFGIKVSRWTIGRILQRRGFSYQKTRKVAYQKDEDKVEHWIEEEYPRILKKTMENNGVVYFMDESGVRSTAVGSRTWGQRGSTPEVKDTGARFGINVLSAISFYGGFRYHIESKHVNARKFIEFLRQIMKTEVRPISLIVDGHPSHHAKIVQKFVASTDGRLKIYFLPGYSPELNPDELVWHHLKHDLAKGTTKSPDNLIERAISSLRSLQHLPRIVKKFFCEKHVKYSAPPWVCS